MAYSPRTSPGGASPGPQPGPAGSTGPRLTPEELLERNRLRVEAQMPTGGRAAPRPQASHHTAPHGAASSSAPHSGPSVNEQALRQKIDELEAQIRILKTASSPEATRLFAELGRERDELTSKLQTMQYRLAQAERLHTDAERRGLEAEGRERQGEGRIRQAESLAQQFETAYRQSDAAHRQSEQRVRQADAACRQMERERDEARAQARAGGAGAGGPRTGPRPRGPMTLELAFEIIGVPKDEMDKPKEISRHIKHALSRLHIDAFGRAGLSDKFKENLNEEFRAVKEAEAFLIARGKIPK